MADDLLDSNIVSGRYSRADILRLVTIGLNSSKMYRADVRDFSLPGFPVMDFLINVEQVGRGFAAFAGVEPLGVYRVGVGVASAGNTTKVVMRDSFFYFLRKYPEYSNEISMAALVLFLAALKNGRWSVCRLYGAVLVKCLRPSTVVDLVASWKIISRLKIPASVKATS
jgi:hypothetical protein